MVRSERSFERATIGLLFVVSLVFVFPMYYVLISSFGGTRVSGVRSLVWVQENANLDAYRYLLVSSRRLMRAYSVTLFRVGVGAPAQLAVTIGLAYGISKRNMRGTSLVVKLLTLTILFNGGLIPTYFVVRSAGVLDSYLAYILPVLVNPWYAILMRNFFWSLPAELEESAFIDGASYPQVLVWIVIPLSTAGIATIFLFYAVGQWNAWIDAVLYIHSARRWPVQMILRQLITAAHSLETVDGGLAAYDTIPPTFAIQCAAIAITTAPILAVYPFLQRYFVKGIMIGSIKG